MLIIMSKGKELKVLYNLCNCPTWTISLHANTTCIREIFVLISKQHSAIIEIKIKKAKRENNIKTHEFDSQAACERCEEKKKYYSTFAMTSPPISDLSNKYTCSVHWLVFRPNGPSKYRLLGSSDYWRGSTIAWSIPFLLISAKWTMKREKIWWTRDKLMTSRKGRKAAKPSILSFLVC